MYPKPRVESSVLSFVPETKYVKFQNAKNLEAVTRVFFSQKRKMINKPFKKLFSNNIKVLNKLNSDRIKLTKKLLKEINPILANYSKDKSLSIIIDKKNVVIGKKDLDITEEILKLLNEKIKEIEIDDEKKTLSKYGSSDSGASLGDILGSVIDKKNNV